MGDSQQENSKGKGKGSKSYESGTMDDTNELLHLLVDAINSGLHDANGTLSKQNWFKRQYDKISTLMRNNSGFGWDPIAKMLTPSDEVWKNYLKLTILV
ncbi:unnamed protein product [Prunus armeniaca]